MTSNMWHRTNSLQTSFPDHFLHKAERLPAACGRNMATPPKKLNLSYKTIPSVAKEASEVEFHRTKWHWNISLNGCRISLLNTTWWKRCDEIRKCDVIRKCENKVQYIFSYKPSFAISGDLKLLIQNINLINANCKCMILGYKPWPIFGLEVYRRSWNFRKNTNW